MHRVERMHCVAWMHCVACMHCVARMHCVAHMHFFARMHCVAHMHCVARMHCVALMHCVACVDFQMGIQCHHVYFGSTMDLQVTMGSFHVKWTRGPSSTTSDFDENLHIGCIDLETKFPAILAQNMQNSTFKRPSSLGHPEVTAQCVDKLPYLQGCYILTSSTRALKPCIPTKLLMVISNIALPLPADMYIFCYWLTKSLKYFVAAIFHVKSMCYKNGRNNF